MIGAGLSTSASAWIVRSSGCVAARACPDDSGPNLLVHAVEFILVLAAVAGVAWAGRRIRRGPRVRGRTG